MACDDEVIPLQERIESVADDADLQEVYDTERHLLYVACTRARDYHWWARSKDWTWDRMHPRAGLPARYQR